jgi:RND family efflux transporter MFP subunit
MKFNFRPICLMLLIVALCAPQFAAAQMTTVRVQALDNLSVPYRRSAPAEVRSLNGPRLSAEIAARVISIPVRNGDIVNAGTLLVKLDCRDYVVRADVARERVRLADIQLERMRKLMVNQNVSETQVDQQETDTVIAQKEFDSANLQVERCEIRSPFAAAIGERLASVGDYLQPGTPVLKLTDLDSVIISARISAVDAESVDEFAEFQLITARGQFPVVLEALSPVVDRADRSREARFRLAQGGQVPIGTIGRLSWASGKPALPSSYLVQRGDELGVFVLDSGKARYVVLPSAEEGRPVEVDLPRGTRIVTDGRERLRDGDEVSLLQ